MKIACNVYEEFKYFACNHVRNGPCNSHVLQFISSFILCKEKDSVLSFEGGRPLSRLNQ